MKGFQNKHLFERVVDRVRQSSNMRLRIRIIEAIFGIDLRNRNSNFAPGAPGRGPGAKSIPSRKNLLTKGVDMSVSSINGLEAGGLPRLRITRRGRGFLTALISTALVLAVVPALVGLNGNEWAASASLSGSEAPFVYVTVEPGQSLWGIAETRFPGSDPRDAIARIMELNQLRTADVSAGQRLAMPVR